MNVVTVRTGAAFSGEYVTLLARMVEEYANTELIVLTDRETHLPGKHVQREHPLQGWWSKLELFAPSFQYRPCLFFDLDTYILGDIRDLLDPSPELGLIRDFNQQSRSNSGVMIIPQDTEEIWQAAQGWRHFNNPRMGDGDFLTTRRHWCINDYYPGIVSYKNHSRDRAMGRIVCFHGKPKPHETTGWAQETWQNWTR